MLKHRLIFGPLMIVGLLGVIYLDNWLGAVVIKGAWVESIGGRQYTLPQGAVMLGAVWLMVFLASRELCGFFKSKGIEADPIMVGLSGLLGCGAFYVLPDGLGAGLSLAILGTVATGLFVGTLIRHSRGKQVKGALAAGAATMFAFGYLGLMPGFFIAIRRRHSAWVIAGIILITKCCDIGAYFVGRAMGRRKLIAWLSPGKTWEGLIGGVVFSAGVATLLAAWANAAHVQGHGIQADVAITPISLWFAGVSGVLLGLVGQMGDLLESLLKRDAGLKDSGDSIPGFGGVLDLCDSPIAVAPLGYWLLQWLAYSGAAEE